MKKLLALLSIMMCLPLMAMAQKKQKGPLIRPILDLTPDTEITIREDISIDALPEHVVKMSSSGGITFVVDENLPAPKPDNFSKKAGGEEIARMIAKNANLLKPGEGFVASSFANDSMLVCNDDVLFCTIVKCFADHRPLVLSPDMVWLVIAQGFSQYANDHAEALRNKLVSHDGKLSLVVKSNKDLIHAKPDWNAIFNDFEKQIAEHSKKDIAKTIVSDFTTTGPTERIASQITLMDAMKQYFEYVVHYLSCGIPTITLTGTPEDWQKVHDKAMALKQYGMGWWTKDLDPILKEFVNASKGKVNQAFWKDMVMKDTPAQLNSRACGGGGETEVDGWFLKLFPYDKDGNRNAEKEKYNKRMLSEMVRVPFRYIVTHEDGTQTENAMELYAGLVSVKEDPTTLALTPQVGWMVRMAEEDNAHDKELLKTLNNQNTDDVFARAFGLELRVKKVPEALRGTKKINKLTLHFTDRVELPEWMESIHINTLTVHGKVTQKEAEALKQRFPHINLDAPTDAKKETKKKRKIEAFRVTEPERKTIPELKLDSVVKVWEPDNRRLTEIIEYDSLYRVKAFYYKDDSTRNTIEYDAQGREKSLTTTVGGKPHKIRFCEYDERGNKTLEGDSVLSADVKTYHKFNMVAFAYDDANRLIVKDIHNWQKDGQAWHTRYTYHYSKKGVLREVQMYEYVYSKPWGRVEDIPTDVNFELVEKDTYNKAGKIAKYEFVKSNETLVYTYDKNGLFASSYYHNQNDVTYYYYDHNGNLIKQEHTDGDGELLHSHSTLYNTSYHINEVAGLRDGYHKLFMPDDLQGSESLHREFTSPILNMTTINPMDNERISYQFYYSAP